jgi:predicted nucleic acid-binding protein
MYLVDTNVWLERLLDREKAGDVGRFLDLAAPEQIFVTDFAFHSIGVILSRLGQTDVFLRFTKDVFIDGGISLIRLEPKDGERLVRVMHQFDLDFDDAYQYVAAEDRDLVLVSLDGDFDRTERGRKAPSEILNLP